MLRTTALAAVAVILAGCAGGFSGFTGGGGIDQLPLRAGAVVAAGPDGYCIDTEASRAGDGFAVLASCAVLSGEGDFPPALALLTVQVGRAGTATVTGAEPDLADLLDGEAGAVLLGTSGAVDLRRVNAGPNLVTVYYVDTSALAGTSATQWRAFTDINGRLVTITMRNLADAPLSAMTGEALLIAAVDRMWLVNGLPVPTEA